MLLNRKLIADKPVYFGGGATMPAQMVRANVTRLPLEVVREPKRDDGQAELKLAIMGDVHNHTVNLLKMGNILQSMRSHSPEDLLINLGDSIEGGMYPSQFMDIIRIMNRMGVDFSLIGNHEFDMENEVIAKGKKELLSELLRCLRNKEIKSAFITFARAAAQYRQCLDVARHGKNILLSRAFKTARFPYLSANLDFAPGSTLCNLTNDNILPHFTFSKNNRLYLFIGLSPDTLEHEFGYHRSKGWESTVSVNNIPLQNNIKNIIDWVKQWQPKMEIRTILASHLGRPRDMEIAFPGIDIILGSHTHNVLYNEIQHEGGKKTLLLHGGMKGYFLPILNINYSDSGELIGNPYLIDVENSTASARFAGFTPERFLYKSQVVGQLSAPLSMLFKSTRPLPLMNLITDAYRTALGTDIAMTFSGSVRDGLLAGCITETDIEKVVPWVEPLTTITMQGKEIVTILNCAISNSKPDSPKVMLLHPSGLTYSINKDGCAEDLKVLKDGQYIPIDMDEAYSIAIPGFLAKSQLFKLDFILEREIIESGITDKIALTSYIKHGKPIDTQARIDIAPEAAVLYNDPDITF